MNEFNVIGICDICKKYKLCTEVIMFNEKKQQKVELWCKECTDEIKEYEARQQELKMQEVYEDIIRSSH